MLCILARRFPLLAFYCYSCTGCGGVEPGRMEVEPGLQEYVTEFVKAAQDHGIPPQKLIKPEHVVVVQWANIEQRKEGSRTIGLCIAAEGIVPIIQVSKEETDPKIIRAIVFHEMGHCVLGIANHAAKGMMSAQLDYQCLTEEGWPVCVQELFTFGKD